VLLTQGNLGQWIKAILVVGPRRFATLTLITIFRNSGRNPPILLPSQAMVGRPRRPCPDPPLFGALAIEQRECCDATAERQDELPSLDLGDRPSADFVANLRAERLFLRSNQHDDACTLPVHHNPGKHQTWRWGWSQGLWPGIRSGRSCRRPVAVWRK